MDLWNLRTQRSDCLHQVKLNLRALPNVLVCRGVDSVALTGIRFVNCSSHPLLASPISVQASAVLITNCRFENNRGHNGGVISARLSNLTLVDCVFRRNQADEYGGSVFAYDQSNIVARGCRFRENRSQNVGGAIRLFNGTSAFVANSSFVRNRGYNGGGIQGLSFDAYAELILSGCTFNGNRGLTGGGGAIALVGVESVIADSSFRDNQGMRTGGAVAFRSAPRANATSEKLVLEIADCDFSNNNASSGGAVSAVEEVVVTISRCSFQGNSAFVRGGALLFSDFARVTCTNSSFHNNSGGGAGGGIYLLSNQTVMTANNNSTRVGVTLSITNGSCQGNFAQSGGCIAAFNDLDLEITDFDISQNIVSGRGGGVFAERIRLLALMHVNFDGNQAGSFGGGLHIFSDAIEDPETSVPLVERGTVFINQSRFQNNTGAFAGGISVSGYMSVFIDNSVFDSNTATQNGGGMYLQAVAYEREDSTVFNPQRGNGTEVILSQARASLGGPLNTASQGLVPALSMTINNSVFASNEAGDIGGAAIILEGCVVWVEHSSFVNNKAGFSGGAYVRQSLFFCQYCAFNDNTAAVSGGALTIHASPYCLSEL